MPILRSVKLIIVAFIFTYWWHLPIKIIFTYQKLFQVYSKRFHQGEKLWAFGATDAAFRPWYNKIARDYKTQGRFGFAWDDALGTKLATNFQNTWFTYYLLRVMGLRLMSALTFIMLAIFTGLILNQNFNGALLAFFLALSFSSPLIIGLSTHLWKPETFWWPLVMMFFYFGTTGSNLTCGLLWSFISIVNLPASIMAIIFIGPYLLFLNWFETSIFILLLGAIPGILRCLWTFKSILGNPKKSGVIKGQIIAQSPTKFFSKTEIVILIPFWISLALGGGQANQIIDVILLGSPITFFYLLNSRLIKFNDVDIFHLGFWIIGVVATANNGSIIAMIPLLALSYAHPLLFGFYIDKKQCYTKSYIDKLISDSITLFDNFPNFKPSHYPLPKELKNFCEVIPFGSRVIIEFDGDLRNGSRMRPFNVWLEDLFPHRQVDVVSEILTQINEPELVENYLDKFCPRSMTIKCIENMLAKLGVSYVICVTTEMARKLKLGNFVQVSELNLGSLGEFNSIVQCPNVNLKIFRFKSPTSVINPSTPVKRNQNKLAWNATSKTTYYIRYKYHKEFVAYQRGEALKIKAYKPFDNSSLEFMQLTALEDGKVELSFKGC